MPVRARRILSSLGNEKAGARVTFDEFNERFQDALAHEGLLPPTVQAELSPGTNGAISFDLVRVSEKRKGIGGRVLKALIRLADEHAVTLEVIAAQVYPDPEAMTDEQLAAWYSANDFVRAPTQESPRFMRRSPR